MNKTIRYTWLFMISLFAACSGETPLDEHSQPNTPTPNPQPEELLIETTEVGSLTFVLSGYADDNVAGGVLKPDGFETPIYINNGKLMGTGYSFALCAGVNRLDEMPAYNELANWTERFKLTQGATCWARHTSEHEYGYVKLRIAYIEGNSVGVEYKAMKVERPKPEDIETTEEESIAVLLMGYLNNTSDADAFVLAPGIEPIFIKKKHFTAEHANFYRYDDVQNLNKMPQFQDVTEWQPTIEVKEGSCYWLRYLAPTEYIYVKLRVAFIDADRVGIEYKLSAHQSYVNSNGNQSGDGKSYVTDFSMPHLNENNYYVEHIATMNGNELLNYALEWNDAMKHAQWVAFSFDKVTIGDVTGRTEAWDVDPKLPEEMRTSNDHHRNDGFDRGHICGSEDRVYSKLANAQTFYYSNMSPQLNAFNGGYWAAFEYRVRRWSRYSFPHLYVAKGGALNHLLVNFKSKTPDSNGNYATTDENGRTIHGLACPKYYYMALLAEKQGTYQALGFWIEHREDYPYEYGDKVPANVLKEHLVSIDQLEELTGLDFFCNLPDELEETVESVLNANAWNWE